MYTAAGIRVRMCTCINKGACTRGRGAGKSTTMMGEHEARLARRGGKRISSLLTRRWTRDRIRWIVFLTKRPRFRHTCYQTLKGISLNKIGKIVRGFDDKKKRHDRKETCFFFENTFKIDVRYVTFYSYVEIEFLKINLS